MHQLARFLLAYMQNGPYKKAQIPEKETALQTQAEPL